MSLWEYKILTSGPLGFGSLPLLETYLNGLGKEQWEIVSWQTDPANPLKFQGLARRPTLRDWFPEALPVAEKKPAPAPARPPVAEEEESAAESAERESAEPARREPAPAERRGDLRPLAASESFDDDDEDEEEDEEEEGDLAERLFKELRPLMRRTQRGGLAGSLTYLAQRLSMPEGELIEALEELGLREPESAGEKPHFLELEGQIYWLNKNDRGQVWLNAKLKSSRPDREGDREPGQGRERERDRDRGDRGERGQPSPSSSPAERAPSAPAPARAPAGEAADDEEDASAPAAGAAPRPILPVANDEGRALLEKLRPLMRRNRRGHGYSGSIVFLARALQQEPEHLTAALAAAGLPLPADPSARTDQVDSEGRLFWLNKNHGGQLWLNAREKPRATFVPSVGPAAAAPRATVPAAAPAPEPTPAPASESAPVVSSDFDDKTPAESPAMPVPPVAADENARSEEEVLAAVRPLMAKNKRGMGFSGHIGNLARTLERPEVDLLRHLVLAGLSVPATPEEKPKFGVQGEEIFWLNRNAAGELWLNAKPKPKRRGRSKKSDDASASPPSEPETAAEGDEPDPF